MIDITQIIVHHLADSPVIPLPHGLTITKHTLMMWMASALAIGVVFSANRAQGYLRTALEGYISFIWDDIVKPSVGEAGRPLLHFFLTLFLFIFIMNLLGLIPFGATATGNISVTAALSLTTLGLIHFFGIKEHGFLHHMKNHIPHGVPMLIAPLVFMMEMMGYVTRSVALCIRLFANMTAGHLVILLFLGLILIFGSDKVSAGLAVAPVSVLLALGLYMLEIIVAFIQAYVFTILTAIFIGSALHPEH